MQLNSLYQLLAMREHGDAALDQARTLLMMPDLFNYWLTGIAVSEFTVATTTQFYDPRARDWARDLLRRLELPTDILPPVRQPGTILGPLEPRLAAEAGLQGTPVILPATHDTGSAVAAVPARDARLYLPELGHLVADRDRGSRADHHARGARVQLHQRGRRGRHVPRAQEHHGAVAGAGVPAHLGAGGRYALL